MDNNSKNQSPLTFNGNIANAVAAATMAAWGRYPRTWANTPDRVGTTFYLLILSVLVMMSLPMLVPNPGDTINQLPRVAVWSAAGLLFGRTVALLWWYGKLKRLSAFLLEFHASVDYFGSMVRSTWVKSVESKEKSLGNIGLVDYTALVTASELYLAMAQAQAWNLRNLFGYITQFHSAGKFGLLLVGCGEMTTRVVLSRFKSMFIALVSMLLCLLSGALLYPDQIPFLLFCALAGLAAVCSCAQGLIVGRVARMVGLAAHIRMVVECPDILMLAEQGRQRAETEQA